METGLKPLGFWSDPAAAVHVRQLQGFVGTRSRPAPDHAHLQAPWRARRTGLGHFLEMSSCPRPSSCAGRRQRPSHPPISYGCHRQPLEHTPSTSHAGVGPTTGNHGFGETKNSNSLEPVGQAINCINCPISCTRLPALRAHTERELAVPSSLAPYPAPLCPRSFRCSFSCCGLSYTFEFRAFSSWQSQVLSKEG